MDSISSIGSNTTPDFGSFLNAMSGNPVGFGGLFSQALSQAKTPADAAKIDWMQAEYSDLVDLSTMGSGSISSLSGSGMGDLFGFGGPFGLPSWAMDAQRVLGSNSDLQQMMSSYQQAAFLMQSQFNQSLADFGSTGGSVNSLI